MHDQTRRLVQDQQVVVLEQNVQRNLLRLRGGGSGRGPVDLNFLSRARTVRGFDRSAVHADVALSQQPLNRAAREGGQLSAQECVEPLVGQRLFDDDNGSGARGHFIRLFVSATCARAPDRRQRS